MILFYRERSGDYLAIETATNPYYRQTFGKDHFERRATAIEGLVTSVCTTGISRGILREHCKRVAKSPRPRRMAEGHRVLTKSKLYQFERGN